MHLLTAMRTELRRRCSIRRDDTGASLVLVLIFVVVCSVLVGALASQATNDLHNTVNFKSARDLQLDAQAAINEAVQSIRYTPLLTTQVSTLNASPPVACWQNTPSPPSGGYTSDYTDNSDGNVIAVWCSTAWYPATATTRVVTFSACPVAATAANCGAAPLLQAVATFDDYPPGGTTAPSGVACVTYCGTGMTVNGWQQRPTLPKVTSVGLTSGSPSCPATTPAGGPVTGGTVVTLCGSGFVQNGSTVEFVEEAGGIPVSDNTVCSSNAKLTPSCVIAGVTVLSPNELTVDSPVVIEGSTYFVSVTTASGTSPYAGNVFTYSAVSPSLSVTNGIVPTTGETVGGTSVTLTGSGFVVGSRVEFIEEHNGVAVSPTVAIPATYVSTFSDTDMTAVAPPIYQGAYPTYFVEVVSPSGATTTLSSAYVFTYTVTTPTVSAVSTGGGTPSESASGPPATVLTVFGTSFYAGETVVFNEEANGTEESTSYAGTNVTVVSASKLTVSTPTPSSGSTFFVNVTTPSPCNPNSDGSNAFCTSTNQAVTFSYPPTVSSITPTSGNAGSTITIAGNDFATDAENPTVSFEEESGGTLVTPPVTVVSTNVTVNNYRSITATVPPIAAGTSYYVTVTTPGGVSWTSGSPYPPVFTYLPPTVTTLNPTSSAFANATVTVHGTDFYTSGTTVTFVPVPGGTTRTGTNVTVTSSTQLSVQAPALTVNVEYYVEVTTPAGTSATSSSDEYKYT